MSKEAKLVVKLRAENGSAACRRLRWSGQVPGNIYGHNAPPTAVVIAADALMPVLQSGAKVVDVELDGKVDKAVVREIQWDTFGRMIQHFDLLRVDPNERVNIVVPLELKGTAPGVLLGGVLEQTMHSITIDCLAYQIPDTIQVRIGSLELGKAIHVSDLVLPEGSHAHAAADAIVVHVVQAKVQEEVASASPVEPEVVGKKPGADAADAKDDKKDAKKK
ncbi:50S ribosomal protein L25 [Schlesneria paludicola]|uniref:50S ribosomal protein L25 n=1 Tax=Schlesneria paludicola TaxID=360056 RepID=UPI00029A7713|nr:50S ribosomal protein L25 [Schlesneria paludicola]